jgi:hypothetical protein
MTINNKALFLFLILLAGLVLSSFLGVGNGHEGFDSIPTYTGVNLGKVMSSDAVLGTNKVDIDRAVRAHDDKYRGYDNYNHYTGTSSQLNNPNASSLNASTLMSGKNSYSGSMSGMNPYSSSMPPGIPASQIPSGHEDLYILKSEIVPPVCPICPSASLCERKEKCPPCPACARCPEPAFECKKVPNYNSSSSEFLPVPVLNSFNSFGM